MCRMYFDHIPTLYPFSLPCKKLFFLSKTALLEYTFLEPPPFSLHLLASCIKLWSHQWYETHSPPKLGIKDRSHLGQVCLLGYCVFWAHSFFKKNCLARLLSFGSCVTLGLFLVSNISFLCPPISSPCFLIVSLLLSCHISIHGFMSLYKI